jgi:hypothetical protein
MKYRIALISFMTAMLAVTFFTQNYKVLASAGLLTTALGIYADRRATLLEKRHPWKADDDPFYCVGLVFGFALAAFGVGVVAGLVTGIGWWSIGTGVVGAMVYFVASWASNSSDKNVQPSRLPTFHIQSR